MTLDQNTRFALLVYDIPQRCSVRNPSNLLRRFGARINLSCWVLPVKNIALLPLKEWIERGCSVEVVEFGESELDKVVAIARRAIARDVEAMRETVEKAVAEVRKRFAAAKALASGSTERDEARYSAEHYAYVVLYRAKGIADSAEECALHFDLTGDVAELVDGLRRTIKAKSGMFYDMQEEVREVVRAAAGGAS